jgi:hypothetical protein
LVNQGPLINCKEISLIYLLLPLPYKNGPYNIPNELVSQFVVSLYFYSMVFRNISLLIIIISLLMSPLLGHRPSLWITHKGNGHNPPRGPSAGWQVLTTANAAGTDGLTCLPKHGGVQDNKFLVTHLMID